MMALLHRSPSPKSCLLWEFEGACAVQAVYPSPAGVTKRTRHCFLTRTSGLAGGRGRGARLLLRVWDA